MQLGLIGNLPQSSLSSTPDFNSWFLEHSFTRSQAYASFEELLRPPSSQKNNQCHRPWQEEIEDNDSLDAFPNSYPHISPLTSYWGLQDLSSVVDASGKTSTANNARDPNVDFLVVRFKLSKNFFFMSYSTVLSAPCSYSTSNITCYFP